MEELEALRQALATRRTILEQRDFVRESVEHKCQNIRLESFKKRQETYRQQMEAAKRRNMQLLHELAQARALGLEGSHLGSSSAINLKKAKERFASIIEERLPLWKEQMLESYQARIAYIEKEKQDANIRREAAKKVFEEEQAMRKVLEQKTRELVCVQVQELKEELERNARIRSFNEEAAEAKRMIMEDITRRMKELRMEHHLENETVIPTATIPESHPRRHHSSVIEPASSICLEEAQRQASKKKEEAELARKQAIWSAERIAQGATEVAKTSKSGAEDLSLLKSLLASPLASSEPLVRYNTSSSVPPSKPHRRPSKKREEEEQEESVEPQQTQQHTRRSKKEEDQHPPAPTLSQSKKVVIPAESAFCEKKEERLEDDMGQVNNDDVAVQQASHPTQPAQNQEEEEEEEEQTYVKSDRCSDITHMTPEQIGMVLRRLCEEIEGTKGIVRNGYPTCWDGQVSQELVAYEQDIYESLQDQGTSVAISLPSGDPAAVCLCLLHIIQISARQLLPMDLLNGLVDEEKITKYHRRMPQSLELWKTIVCHLCYLLDSSIMTHEDLLLVFSEALLGDDINLKTASERSRLRRKVTTLLESIGKNTLELSRSGGDRKKDNPESQQQQQVVPEERQPMVRAAAPEPPSNVVTPVSSFMLFSSGESKPKITSTPVMFGARSSSKKKLNLSHTMSLAHTGSVRCLDDIEGDEITDLDDLVGSGSRVKDSLSPSLH